MFLYYLVFWVILFFAIAATRKCIRKPAVPVSILAVSLFALAISMIIPGFKANTELPNGIKLSIESPPLLTQAFTSNKQTDFRLANSTNSDKEIEVKIQANAPIKNIALDQGEGTFSSVIEGGEGNNYAVYKVLIPPGQVASGTVVSSDIATLKPIWNKKDK